MFLLEAQGGNPFPAFTGSWRLPAFLSSGPLTLQLSSYKDPGEYIGPTWATEYFQTLDSITFTKSVLPSKGTSAGSTEQDRNAFGESLFSLLWSLQWLLHLPAPGLDFSLLTLSPLVICYPGRIPPPSTHPLSAEDAKIHLVVFGCFLHF